MAERPGPGSGAGKNVNLAAGTLVFLALVLVAVLAPVITPYGPHVQVLSEDLGRPSLDHPLGQDKLGRDQLCRLAYGARVSLYVGLSAFALSLSIGLLVGCTAGYLGGATDFWLMRLVDVLMAFPGILLAITLSAVLGPGLNNVVVALGVTGWTGYARLARGEVLGLRRSDHVEAARALGLPTRLILLRHVVPLLAAPMLVQSSFGIAGAIVAEASLSFLGLGVQPPTPSWGSMLNEGRAFMLVAPHMTLFPGIAILVTVLGLNALGDGLRDYLDTRLG
ncbi:MAG: ABC transporter permease [Candidatus Binatia bacterium]